MLKETVFGYIISGVVHNSSSDLNFCCLIMKNNNVEDRMKKIWEIENISDTDSPLNNEELLCKNSL